MNTPGVELAVSPRIKASTNAVVTEMNGGISMVK